MVGAADIVADGFGRVGAEEDRAGVADLFGKTLRVGDAKLQMFGRNAVGEGRRLIQIAGDDDGAVVAPARPCDGAPLQRLQLPLYRRRHSIAECGVVGDEDRLGAFVMLGLAHQIHRDPVGVVVAVGDDKDLRRSGDHVDADLSENPPLGGGDESVAGAGDLVHRRDRSGAIGERGDRLRAADAIDSLNPRQPRRQQNQRVHLAVRRRRRDDEAGNARDLRRDGVHQDG